MSRWTALWTALSVLLVGVLTVAVGLAVGVVPKSLRWAHNTAFMWSVVAGLIVLAVATAVLQARSSAGKDVPAVTTAPGPQAWVKNTGSGAVVLSNTGTVVHAKKVIIGGAAQRGSPGDPPHSVVTLVGDDTRSRDNLPRRNPVFTGRATVLETVALRLAHGPVAVVAVRGLGGVGKSQVALEYAHRMVDAGGYRIAGWVRADSPVTIAEDLAALAPLAGLGTDGPPGEVHAAVIAALAARSDWLVVFDNAPGPSEVADLLPKGGGHVLITSRNRRWSGVATQLDVEVFHRTESVAFLSARTGRSEPQAANELAKELGDLPLALAQAAAYIDTNSTTIAEYLALYMDPAVGRRLRAAGLEAGEYPASIARTWLLHFDRLQEECPAAVDLLRLCAFLDPDSIDISALGTDSGQAGTTLAEALGDPLRRAETTGALARTSLITRTASGQLRVHRLVQAVTRDQLDEFEVAAWAGRVTALLADEFPKEPWRAECWPVCAKLTAHVEAAVTHATSLPDLSRRCGALLFWLGSYLGATAQYSAACTSLLRAVAIEEAAYEPDDPQLAVTLGNLGIVQLELGEFAAARATQQRALTILEAAYGPDHLEVARTLVNLANVQLELGELEAARAAQQRALTILEAGYGPDHPHVARTLVNLGIVERDLGDLEAARALQQRAVSIFEAAYGPDHPDLATALTNLGILQLKLGQLEAARATQQRALTTFEAVYGAEHPDFAKALRNLGNVELELGEPDAARGSHERALCIFNAVYGPDHPATKETKQLLGD